ncbi:MAG: hypothetical protein WA765_11490 [Candidatus Acidiferrum sp.]
MSACGEKTATPSRIFPRRNLSSFFLSPAFITPFTEKSDYLANTRIWKVERETETTQAYFYDPVGAVTRHAQVAFHAKRLRSDEPPAPKP